MVRSRLLLVCGIAIAALGMAGGSDAIAQSDPFTTVGLLWTAPGDDDEIGQATRYEVRFSSSPAGTDTLAWWNSAMPVSPTSIPRPSPSGQTDSLRVTGLTAGTTYYFAVRAADEIPNWSGFSNVATGTTSQCDRPQSAPEQFQASEDSTSGDVLLSWSGTTDPQAVDIHIYRRIGSGALSLIQTLDAATTQYRDNTTNPGTDYLYTAAWSARCGAVATTGEGPRATEISIRTSGTGPGPQSASAQATVRAYPNPAEGDQVTFVLDLAAGNAQNVQIRLFDMSGHWIATLADGSYTPGQHQISWGRRSRQGSKVAPGYYEVLGTVGSARVRERLVLLP